MASGLSDQELDQVSALIGRTPNELEKGVFGAMWSEHCSYKSSRAYLKNLPKASPRVLVGPGENAGAVDIGDGLCVVFKVESHNHPSYIEPFQGAATGVGGILRDVFTMGARPFATMNLLRFGSKDHPKTAQLVEGATRGLSSYGNCFGVANVASDVAFDSCYDGNILVNAFAIGICRHEDLQSGVAKGVGNLIIYVGAKTGRDGIHGATMASESFGDNANAKRPTVQVGDPFKEKLLLEACLECFERKLIVGIQDMGAAGLTSSSYEMATRGDSGLNLQLDRVPLRDGKMTPYEIMLSESQERMLLVATKENAREIKAIFYRYGLDAVEIGEVTNCQSVDLYWQGECVSSLNPNWLTNEAPIEMHEAKAPFIDGNNKIEKKGEGEVRQSLNRVFEERNSAAHFEQYDRHIGLGTIAATDESDAALIRILGTNKFVALTIGCDEKLCAIDPNEGVKRSLVRQILQLACVGAEAIGLTNCLNFGSPKDKEVMWQFKEAVEGLAEAARVFDVPVVSGNVSLYNQTNDNPIYPTPTLCLVGLREGSLRKVTRKFKRIGDTVVFIGRMSPDLTMTEDCVCADRMIPRKLNAWNLKEARHLAEKVTEMVNAGEVDTACCVGDGGILGTVLRMSGPISIPMEEQNMFSEESVGVVIAVDDDNLERVTNRFKDFEILALGRTMANA